MRAAVAIAVLLALCAEPVAAAPAIAAPRLPRAKPHVTAERAVAALTPFLGDWETTQGGRLRYLRLAHLEGTDWIVMVEGDGHAAQREPAGRHASPTLIGYLWGGYRVLEVPGQGEVACQDRSSFLDATFDGKATLSWETCFLKITDEYGFSLRRRLMRVGDRLIQTERECYRGQPCGIEGRTEYTRVAPAGDFGFRPKR